LGLIIVEEPAAGDVPALDSLVARRDAAPPGLPVAFAGHDLEAAIDILRHIPDQRDFIADRVGIARRQRGRAMAASPYTRGIARACLDPDQVVAELVELGFGR